MILESEIEQKLVRKIREIGGKAYKFVSPGNAGVPDRIVILPDGVIWFVELKTKRGTVSGIQKRQMEALRRLGCNVFVLRGEEGLEAFMKEVKKE